MKLDYLQFLELEMFTRFGARLEAGMEKSIRRGRVLREILKQERLAPLSIEFQLAWMIAFNDGLLDGVEPQQVQELMAGLQGRVEASGLQLDDPRRQWVALAQDWLPSAAGSQK